MWFRKRKERKAELAKRAAKVDEAVQVHKDELDRVIQRATKSSARLIHNLEVRNGVTLSIHMAAGGRRH